MAIAAQKFGCRPSALIALRDPVLALDFDLAAAARLLALECVASQAIDEAGGEQPQAIAGQSRARNLYW